ncbi:MAG: hypothetical protein H6719_10125 [Sandaracinaceae bacterium]|nr:hypothetical protein [Sandaracinaceae bacterium]
MNCKTLCAAVLLLLPACGSLEPPLVSGPPTSELAQTELMATACPDGHGQMPNMGFEAPELRGMTAQRTLHEVEGWTTVGPPDAQMIQVRGNPWDEHVPTAPADTQYSSIPIGGALRNTMQVQAGQPYVLMVAHRQGERSIGQLVVRLEGAALPDSPTVPVIELTHQGSVAWEWIRVPFVSQGPQVALLLGTTDSPERRVLDHRAHGHFVDLGGVWRICDAPAGETPTAGGEAAIGGGLGAAMEGSAE